MKRSGLRTLWICSIMALHLCCPLICVASESPEYYEEPPLVKTVQYYVELYDWSQGSIDGTPSGSEFLYRIYTSEGVLLQEIKINCPGDDLYFSDWKNLQDLTLADPKTLVDLKDLNGDFHDDLKILVKNKDGEKVYHAYLWDKQSQSFILAEYPSWLIQNCWFLVGGAGCLILLWVGLFVRRKKNKKRG